MSTVIEVDDVWKKYRLGIIGTGTLRHDFERWWHRVRGKPDPHAKIGAAPSANGAGAKVASPDLTPLNGAESDLGDHEVWALRGVSFEVKQGEILGIIGRNGAGKSTLLKILSRVTSPTKGEVRIKGRIASLLEVGTGFHPELTGRENIFLNGAILGMTKAEIRTQLDEIVAFAEIEKFLDTPVKRYSSGMYVRLAFAVAAHLEPEILIVDEVLAVGDAQFQKKCMGKMEEVSDRDGRTILFVSHSMLAVERLCSRVVLLSNGKLEAIGITQEMTRHYLATGLAIPSLRVWPEDGKAPGDACGRLRSIAVKDGKNQVRESLTTSEPFCIEVDYLQLDDRKRLVISLHFVHENGTLLFVSNDWDDKRWWTSPRKKGCVKSICSLPANFFSASRISVLVGLCSYNPDTVHGIEREAVSFQIVEDLKNQSPRAEYGGNWPGVLRPNLDWRAGYVEKTDTNLPPA